MYKINSRSAKQIVDSGEVKYWQDVEDILKANKITVDFKTACELKGIKPKIGVKKLQYKKVQADRMCNEYPSAYFVAKLFNIECIPLQDDDFQPSNWGATHAYITAMYSKDYVKSFTPAGVNSSLRMAA